MSISGLQPEENGRMLCIMNGAGAAFSGGALGYVFGFGEHLYVAEIRLHNALDITSIDLLVHHPIPLAICRHQAHQAQGSRQMESLQNGRLDFRKGQPIENIDKVPLYELAAG